MFAAGAQRAAHLQVHLGTDAALIQLRAIMGHAPIHHQYLAVVSDHHVAGLQVAVQNAVAVGESDAVAGAHEDFNQAAQVVFAAVARPVLLQLAQDRAQRFALHALHRKIDADVVEHAEPMHRNNIRVIDLGGRPGFPDERFNPFGLIAVLGPQDFQRDFPVQPRLPRGKDRSDAADADRGKIVVILNAVPLRNIQQLAQLLGRDAVRVIAGSVNQRLFIVAVTVRGGEIFGSV